MYKRLIINIIIALFSYSIYGQAIYFKPYARYHKQATTQISPAYFDFTIPVPPGTLLSGGDEIYLTYLSTVNKFSLANGMSYGFTVGYSLNSPWSFELGVDYFEVNESFIGDKKDDFFSSIKSNWQLKTLNFQPAVLFRKEFNKLEINA